MPKLFIASLTFIIGVEIESDWVYIRSRPLSLCSFSDNSASYDGKIAHVSGELYVSANGMVQLNGIECGLRSNAWADVSFRENPKLIPELRQLSDADNFAKADVVLIGRVVDRKRSCFSAQFEISEAELERASNMSIVNFPEEIKKEVETKGH